MSLSSLLTRAIVAIMNAVSAPISASEPRKSAITLAAPAAAAATSMGANLRRK
jgi:hypothetical protein